MNGNRNTKTIRKAGNRGRYLWIGGILSGFMVLLILISFFWTPYGTTAMDASVKFSPPTLQHIMGCDSYGRDIFSRILEGAGHQLPHRRLRGAHRRHRRHPHRRLDRLLRRLGR